MTRSNKRKANSEPNTNTTNKKIKTNKMPRKKIRGEFIGSLDAAIKMLRDNCNLSEHMEELNKTPFRHIFQLIAKMKRKGDVSWCKRYNECMRQIVDSYNVQKKTIRVGDMEIQLTEDKVRAAFGIVDGPITIDLDKKLIDETEDGKDFISRCFPEKKKVPMVTPKKGKKPKVREIKEDESQIENVKEPQEEEMKEDEIQCENDQEPQDGETNEDENISENGKGNQEGKARVDGIQSENGEEPQEGETKDDENESENVKEPQEGKTNGDDYTSENDKEPRKGEINGDENINESDKEPQEGETKEDENESENVEGFQVGETKEDENENVNYKEGMEIDEQKVPKEHVETILGSDLYKKLMENKLSSSDFARVATLYLLTWVFLPTLGFSCALRNLHLVGSMENMCSYNWSRLILDSLNKGLERNKKTSGMKSGCVVLLMYCLCEETNLIQPLNTSFPRFARWDLKQLHVALKKTKLVDVDPEMVVDYIEPSEQERRLLQGDMLEEEGLKLIEWNDGTSRDSEKKRSDNGTIFKDVDEAVAIDIKTPHESEIAKFESEIAKFESELEALKKENERMDTMNEELKRENQSLRSENTVLALQLEAYKVEKENQNDEVMKEKENEDAGLEVEDETMNEKENGDNQKDEGMNEEENAEK